MNKEHVTILKFISILQRNTNRYFDLMLDEYGIGSGQQFFLLRIYENQDITMLDLSRLGSFDKGTVTKAVQKLTEEGYVTVTTDQNDKRVRHLHTTDKALPVIEKLYEVRNEWINSILRDLDEDERLKLFNTLDDIAYTSSNVIQKIISEKGERNE